MMREDACVHVFMENGGRRKSGYIVTVSIIFKRYSMSGFRLMTRTNDREAHEGRKLFSKSLCKKKKKEKIELGVQIH